MFKYDREDLIKQLAHHEGVVLKVYKDSLGIDTIGIGRNVDVNGGLGLSDEEVDFLLEKDIERVIKELSTEYVWFSDLDEVRKDAMIDISFNLGATRLRKFVLALDAMATADYKTAAKEFLDSDWSRTVKGRSVELAAMIETGEYSE